MPACPCGSNNELAVCCSRFISGNEIPQTAEELMRSRFTAYSQNKLAYLEKTYHVTTRTSYKGFDADNINWINLEILEIEGGKPDDNTGTVDFIAHYETHNTKHAMREKSSFIKENEHWFYLDGKAKPLPTRNTAKTGRNDPCICGSGKKYKKCCG